MYKTKGFTQRLQCERANEGETERKRKRRRDRSQNKEEKNYLFGCIWSYKLCSDKWNCLVSEIERTDPHLNPAHILCATVRLALGSRQQGDVSRACTCVTVLPTSVGKARVVTENTNHIVCRTALKDGTIKKKTPVRPFCPLRSFWLNANTKGYDDGHVSSYLLPECVFGWGFVVVLWKPL